MIQEPILQRFAQFAPKAALLLLGLALGGIVHAVRTQDLVVALVGVILGALAFAIPVKTLAEWSKQDMSTAPGRGMLIMGAVLALMAGSIAQTLPSSVFPLPVWIMGLVLLVCGAMQVDGISLSPLTWLSGLRQALWKRDALVEVCAILALTLFAFSLRGVNLFQFPLGMHFDEGDSAVQGLKILDGTFGAGPFVTGWYNIPTLYSYAQALSLAIFGRDEAGVRMMTALAGTFLVPLTWVIGRIGWGRLMGSAAAILMTVSHLFINYSRMAGGFLEPAVFACGLLMLPAIIREGRRSSVLFIVVGITIGLSVYQYYSGRLVPIIAAVLMLAMTLRRVIKPQQVGISLVACLLVAAPLLMFYASRPDQVLGRTIDTSIFLPANMRGILERDGTLERDGVELILRQVRRASSLFLGSADYSGKYFADKSAPGFDPITSLLFWLGAASAVAKVKRYHEFALLTVLTIGFFFGMVLVMDQPAANRAMVMLPSVILLAGLGAHSLIGIVVKYLPLKPVMVAAPLITILALHTFAFNFGIYFRSYPVFVEAQQTQRPLLWGREIRASLGKYEPWVLGVPQVMSGFGAFGFVTYPNLPRTLDMAKLPPLPSDGRGLMFLVSEARQADFESLKTVYPKGVESRLLDSQAKTIFLALRVAPQ